MNQVRWEANTDSRQDDPGVSWTELMLSFRWWSGVLIPIKGDNMKGDAFLTFWKLADGGMSQGWNRRSGLMRFLIWCYRYENWQQRMSGLTRPEASAEVYTCSEHPINHTASCRDRRCLIRLMLPSTCFNTCSSIAPLTNFQLLRDSAWPCHKDYNSPTVGIVHLKDVTKGYTLTRKWRQQKQRPLVFN